MKKTEEFIEVEWKHERLEEGSHRGMLDQPEKEIRLVLDWLKRN